jgi:hypothetical protein
VLAIRVWGLLPLPRVVGGAFSTQVEIQGPQNVLFKVDLPLGLRFRAVSTAQHSTACPRRESQPASERALCCCAGWRRCLLGGAAPLWTRMQ